MPNEGKHQARLYAYFRGSWIGEVEDRSVGEVFSRAGNIYGVNTQNVRAEGIKLAKRILRKH